MGEEKKVVTAEIERTMDVLDTTVTVKMPLRVVKALVAVLSPLSPSELWAVVASKERSKASLDYLRTIDSEWLYDLYTPLEEIVDQHAPFSERK